MSPRYEDTNKLTSISRRSDIQRHVSQSVDAEQLRRFTQQVLRDLETLEDLLESGQIEGGIQRLGAEQELFLVDRELLPASISHHLLDRLAEPCFTHELGRFNLEINLDPLELTGSCFRELEEQLTERLSRIQKVAEDFGASVLLTGILPTLQLEHLGLDHMSPEPRYFALNEALKRLRRDDYSISIRGLDEIDLEHANVMLEACNTSFQVHYQVSAEDFAATYNVAQAIAGPVLAMAVNSPMLFGRRLWAETRIPLFEQSVDTRGVIPPERRQMPRVTFGDCWVEKSVLEIYREDVIRFPAIFPLETDRVVEAAEGPPDLNALCKHNGTVYRWNRPCYGICEGQPHLRIENRYLPSGPTVVDEVANSAFWCGLLRGAVSAYPAIHRQMPFRQARENFLRGARHGLEARFEWAEGAKMQARDLLGSVLLPLARDGLGQMGIDSSDIDHYLGIIDERVATGRTGAHWILDSIQNSSQTRPRSTDLVALVSAMCERQQERVPVSRWAPPNSERLKQPISSLRVRDLMTRSPFTVREDQPVDLAACLMHWRHIRHVPVEDQAHRLQGLVTHQALLRAQLQSEEGPKAVHEVMLRDVRTVAPESPAIEALETMEKCSLGCLPVVQRDQLVGILSERDFLPLVKGRLRGAHQTTKLRNTATHA